MEPVLVALAVLALAALIWFVSTKNRYAWLENLVRESWSGIDVQLKRRYDLVPNLVRVVQGYAAHEREVFERVTEARNEAAKAVEVAAQARSNQVLVSALNGLIARAEAYPELKASANFLELQKELANTEDRIAAARRFYNANVRDFNTLLHSFPSSLLSGNRRPKDFFECEEVVVPQFGD